jgi:hypothetical protein
MRIMEKHLLRTAIAFVISAVLVHDAFAYITLNGIVPVSRAGVVILQANGQSGATGTLKFKFSAPTPGAYSMDFCIGPTENTCGLPTSYVVVVPGGQERLAVVNAGVFTNNVLVVAQGTTRPLPFSVTIE